MLILFNCLFVFYLFYLYISFIQLSFLFCYLILIQFFNPSHRRKLMIFLWQKRKLLKPSPFSWVRLARVSSNTCLCIAASLTLPSTHIGEPLSCSQTSLTLTATWPMLLRRRGRWVYVYLVVCIVLACCTSNSFCLYFLVYLVFHLIHSLSHILLVCVYMIYLAGPYIHFSGPVSILISVLKHFLPVSLSLYLSRFFFLQLMCISGLHYL